MVWDEVLLVSSMINSLCHMFFHFLTRLGESIARPSHPWVFVCYILTHCLAWWFWKASDIIPKHICLCGMKFYCVIQRLTHFVRCFFTDWHVQTAVSVWVWVWPDIPTMTMGFCLLYSYPWAKLDWIWQWCCMMKDTLIILQANWFLVARDGVIAP